MFIYVNFSDKTLDYIQTAFDEMERLLRHSGVNLEDIKNLEIIFVHCMEVMLESVQATTLALSLIS